MNGAIVGCIGHEVLQRMDHYVAEVGLVSLGMTVCWSRKEQERQGKTRQLRTARNLEDFRGTWRILQEPADSRSSEQCPVSKN